MELVVICTNCMGRFAVEVPDFRLPEHTVAEGTPCEVDNGIPLVFTHMSTATLQPASSR